MTTMASTLAPPIAMPPGSCSAEEQRMKDAVACICQSRFESFKAIAQESLPVLIQKDTHSKTLLHFAAEVGRYDFVCYIVESLRSSDMARALPDVLNAPSKLGFTAMMLAAEQGNEEIVEYLLREGARFEITSIDGKNALDLAAHAGYASLADLLIRNGARINDSRTFRQVYLAPLRGSSSKTLQLEVKPESTACSK